MNRRGSGRLGCLPGDEDETAEINLAPMIDILFILLIFFLVTSTFVREAGVPVERPGAVTTEQVESSAIMVAIRSNGEIWTGGSAVDLRRLRGVIAAQHARKPQAPVILQADRASPVGLLVKVMDEIRFGGIRDIAVAAQAP